MNALIFFILLAQSAPSTQGKKLIKYGQEFPNTAYVRDHIAKRPFAILRYTVEILIANETKP